MNKERFIEQYVASFLGAYAANMYYDGTRHNWQKTILKPPVEDAVFQAEQAWEHGNSILPYDFIEEPKQDDPF